MPHKAARVRWALEEPGLPMSTVKPLVPSKAITRPSLLLPCPGCRAGSVFLE